MKTWVVQTFCLAFGLLLCSALLAEIFLYSQNSLINNGNWIATKRKMPMAVMGSDEFLISRSTLAGNALDLGSWHGYQEVLLKEPRPLQEVGFRFTIPDNSYLDILFDKQNNDYSGLRLSRSKAITSGYYSSDPEGRFIAFVPIDAGEIGPGWHQARLAFQQKNLTLRVDQGNPTPIDSRLEFAGRLGFRAGLNGAVVDDFEARDTQGAYFTDSFRNNRAWLKLVLVHFILLSAIFGLLIFLLFKAASRHKPVVMSGSLVVAAQLIVCLSLFHAFDFYYWSRLPFQTRMRVFSTGVPVPQLLFEEYRSALSERWASLVGEEQDLIRKLSLNYPTDRIFQGPIFCGSTGGPCRPGTNYTPAGGKKSGLRFLLVGTSQSVGSGALSMEQSFFVRIHRGLSKAFKGQSVESLNLSVSGSRLGALTDLVQKHADFSPDLVLLNYSNNGSSDHLYEDLQRFIEVSRKYGAKVALVAEANAPEGGENYGLNEKHKIMKRAGHDFGVQVFSMQEFLEGPAISQSGQVWWDHVHLTTYGQALVAKWLQPKVSALVRNEGEPVNSRHQKQGSRLPTSDRP